MQPTPILLWDYTLIAATDTDVPASTTLPHDGDRVLGVCAFIESLTPTPKAIRLFYHGHTVEMVTAAVPKKSSRPIFQKVLAPKYPALALPSTSWSAHTPRANASGTTSLIYFENDPFLSQLRAALTDRGITMLTAIHPLVLAESIPPINQPDHPSIVLISSDAGAIVFYITAKGDRKAEAFAGDDMHTRLNEALVTAFSIFDTARPFFLLVNAGSAPLDPTTLPAAPTKTFSISEFLQTGARTKFSPLANFLPPISPFKPHVILLTAAALLFAVAATIGFQYVSDVRVAAANRAFQEQQETELTREIARLNANKRSIEAAKAYMTEIAGGPRSKALFLETLSRARPQQITIRSITLNESSWTITGTVHEGLGADNGPFVRFYNALKKGPWTFGPDAKIENVKSPDFILTGTFP